MSLAILAAAARHVPSPAPRDPKPESRWSGGSLARDPAALPSHSSRDGAPHIRCRASFSDQLAGLLSGQSGIVRSVAVYVEWGGADATGPFVLEGRHRGRVLAQAEAATVAEPLALEVAPGAGSPPLQPGEGFVFELRWPAGSRHLHVLAPLTRSASR